MAVDANAQKSEEIVDTAITCFARYGVRRTRVEDVADAASISRPTFYRHFSGRQELIDAVVVRQLDRIVSRFGPSIWDEPDAGRAIVEGSVAVLEACRADAVFMELLHRARRDRLSDLSLHRSAFAHPMAARLWQPVIEAARARGTVRPHLTDDDEIVTWLSSVHLLFLLRADLGTEEIRTVMRKFVVSGILVP